MTGASVRASVAFLRPAPTVPEVAREFTSEGCCVDRVRWFDHPRGEWVEAVTLSTD
jgi:hypothetical protein